MRSFLSSRWVLVFLIAVLCFAVFASARFQQVLYVLVYAKEAIREHEEQEDTDFLLWILKQSWLPSSTRENALHSLGVLRVQGATLSVSNSEIARLRKQLPKAEKGLFDSLYAGCVGQELNPELVEIVRNEQASHDRRFHSYLILAKQHPSTDEARRQLEQLLASIEAQDLQQQIERAVIRLQNCGVITNSLIWSQDLKRPSKGVSPEWH